MIKRIALALSTVTAAGLSIWASSQSVDDNIDTMIADINRAGDISFWAAIAAAIAAAISVADLLQSRR